MILSAVRTSAFHRIMSKYGPHSKKEVSGFNRYKLKAALSWMV